VTRNRFHADPRRFTGAVLRFPDGTLPREREAIAESVTGGLRVITHDGYRMAAWRHGRGHAAADQALKCGSNPVHRVYLGLLTTIWNLCALRGINDLI